jgi:hypothetical protein
MRPKLSVLLWLAMAAAAAAAAAATSVNITNACVNVGRDAPPRATVFAQLLLSQVAERARGATWSPNCTNATAGGGTTFINLATDTLVADPEGFRIDYCATDYTVSVFGADERGLLFGVGRLLRLLDAQYAQGYTTAPQSSVMLDVGALPLVSQPAVALRGHQLGYRPKTNSYDGWTEGQFERYISELALFGTNLIELMPWRTDDVAFSPMFEAEPKQMLRAVAQAVDKYGLWVGLWWPLMEKDYSDPATLKRAQAEWAEVLELLPALSMVQVPAGDPGSRAPAALLAAAELLAAAVRLKFPAAAVWVGPQEWSPSEMGDWRTLVGQPGVASWDGGWLDGVVYGPHTCFALEPFVNGRYSAGAGGRSFPLRLYPDLTHSLTTQFPVPQWDRAFAVTESREVVNPRPLGFAAIASAHLKLTDGVGFSSYSEGCHDDVSKIVWSVVAWGFDQKGGNAAASSSRSAADNATALARFAVGDWATAFGDGSAADREAWAQLVMGLEQAWAGPLLTNAAVKQNLASAAKLELGMSPRGARSWRLQQLRYRAAYDAMLQLRLQRQTAQEAAALLLLRRGRGSTPRQPSSAAIAAATAALADSPGPQEAALFAKVQVLAGMLFQGPAAMQLSVESMFAEYTVRGANMDTAALPLANAPYLLTRFAAIEKGGGGAVAGDEDARWAALSVLVDWGDAGAGGFYDDLGSTAPGAAPHLVYPKALAEDPDYYANPLSAAAIVKDLKWQDRLQDPAVALDATVPVAWQTVALTFYGAPLTLVYTELNATAAYVVTVVYVNPTVYAEEGRLGSTPDPSVALYANGFLVHNYTSPPAVTARQAFSVPAAALAKTTTLNLTWTMPADVGGSGTGCHVAEVLLQPKQ